jgi:flagellar capping protein FliD
MDYKKLKEKIILSHGQIKKFFEKEGDSIDFSEGGFYQALKNDSLKVCTLEEISKRIKVPMTYWWSNDESGKVGDFNQQYGNKLIDSLEKNIRVYEKTIEEKDHIIKALEEDKRKLLIRIDDIRKKEGFSKASGCA